MVTAIWDTAVVAIITVGAAAAAAATTMVIDGELVSDHSEKVAPVGGLFSFQLIAPCRLADALACPRAGIATQHHKIFGKSSGNVSVTVKGSLTPLTQAFRILTKLFWNATGHADEA